MRLFYSLLIFDPIRRFRDIERFLENIFQNAQYLKNGESDQECHEQKRRGITFRVFVIHDNFLIRVAIFEIVSILENIFPKTLNISKTANRIKKV